MHLHDNPTSRKNHESSLKHKNATAHRLRNILKKTEKKTADQLKTDKIMDQINQVIGLIQAAARQYGKDTGQRLSDSAFTRKKDIPKTANISLYGLGNGGNQAFASELPSAPVWQIPESESPFGVWEAVPEPVGPSVEPIVDKIEEKSLDVEYEEDAMGDDPKQFKIVEKKLVVEETESDIGFKKRKSVNKSFRKK